MEFWRDARYAVRLLRRSPGFTIVAVLTLALGIGASTTVFTLVNALLLRPLPFRDAQDLVFVTSLDRSQPDRVGCLTYPRYTLIAAEPRAFASLAAFAGDTANLTGTGYAEQVQVGRVSWNFFDLLGINAVVGRTFIKSDDRDATAVVISDSLWRRAFGARTDIAGRTLTLDGRTRTVAGVLPAGFTFGLLNAATEVWLPQFDQLSLATPEQVRGGTCYLNAVGRLPAGSDVAQVQVRMDVLNGRYAREFVGLPDADTGRRMRVEPLREVLVAGTGPMLSTLAAAVALVLLVACANVAGLLLARALARRRELAVRTALGAARSTLMRQLLTESVVLALGGGLAGTLLGVAGTRALATTIAGALPRGHEIVAGVDIRVLAFAAALSLVTALVFGLSPALHFSRPDLPALTSGNDAPARGGVRPVIVRRTIVIAQIAMTVVLLISAGLLVRTFSRLQALNPGFDGSQTLTMNLTLPHAGYSASPQMVAFYQRLLETVQAMPGIRSASAASALPVNASRASPVLIEGQPVVPLAERPIIALQMVLGPYFQTMRIPVVRGRAFDGRDVATSQPVVVVNQALVRKYFGSRDPVGRHITLGRRAVPAEIVGVVGDVKNQSLASDPVPEIDVPFAQLAWASMNLIVRTDGDPSAAASTVRAAIASVDPAVPATRVQTMEDVLSAARSRPRVMMTLVALFALTALTLATIGLYGLIAYSVSQRNRELGIRLALGAEQGDLMRTVVRQGVVLAAIGVATGIAASFAVTRLLASLMFQVTTTDAASFSVGPGVFLLLGAVASWIPARRVARVDPSRVLKTE